MIHYRPPLLFFCILFLFGCQPLPWQPSKPDILPSSTDEDQIYRLFKQGKRYDELNNAQRIAVCKQLKQDHKHKADWQTAWLLAYALNEQYQCISLKESLDLLNDIQKSQGFSSQLHWLNKNQIKLLTKLYKSQKKNGNRDQLLKKAQNQLKRTQQQLRQLESNIQDLKTIESSINRKNQ